MEENIELQFKQLLKVLEKDFGEGLDLQIVLFLIGVQELGQGFKNFTKNEKMDLMHIAVCSMLKEDGYYELDHYDEDNWPHFKLLKNLPKLNKPEQDIFMKQNILNYFKHNEIYSPH